MSQDITAHAVQSLCLQVSGMACVADSRAVLQLLSGICSGGFRAPYGFKNHSHNLVSPLEPCLEVGIMIFHERRLEEVVVFKLTKVMRRFGA